jgi:hypothetical protein
VQPQKHDITSSRPYQIALTVAVLLFLATLTAAILIILIANARRESRETQFDVTLTAVYSDVVQTENALLITPTPAPLPVYGQFPFVPDADGPVYSAAETCDQQILTGSVLDQQGDLTDAYRVDVWGDYLPRRVLSTGALAQQNEGRWTLPLTSTINRRLWVQLAAGDRYVSAPVEIVFGAENCDQNRVEIVFKQITPLP